MAYSPSGNETDAMFIDVKLIKIDINTNVS